jgi:YD repeat-containing protein
VTIRAKLYAAIAMTVVGPLVTIGVALQAFGALGDRFDDVSRRGADQALALELKFAVTDANGWQTAYGYDGGRSRARFVASSGQVRRLLAGASRTFTEPGERTLVGRLRSGFGAFMRLDAVAYRALRAGQSQRVRRILLGPEIDNFRRMAQSADALAAAQARRVAAARRGFADERRSARRRLVAVGLGAGVLIVLLLLTAQDVARAALERR